MTRDNGEPTPLPRGLRFVTVPEVSVEEQIEILERIEKRARDPVVQRDIHYAITLMRNNGSSK
ncbi:MAG: hypothetical protein ACM3WU_11150 [Bacillota bacterium]